MVFFRTGKIDLLANNSLWTEGVRLNHHPPFRLVKCATLNMPETRLSTKSSTQIVFGFDNYFSSHMFLEPHENGGSLHNYLLNWQLVEFVRPGVQTMISLDMTVNHRIDNGANGFRCNPQNTLKVTDCINRFIVKELKCLPPWLTYLGPLDKPCRTTQDLDSFIDLVQDFTDEQNEARVEEMGCLMPNCYVQEWKHGKYFDFAVLPNSTINSVSFTLARGSKVQAKSKKIKN